MLIGCGMLRVGEALVVEVVQEAHEPPIVRVLAVSNGKCPHGYLDGIHVPAKRLGLGVLVNKGEGLVAGHGHWGKLPRDVKT
jgi:hypothetical protein